MKVGLDLLIAMEEGKAKEYMKHSGNATVTCQLKEAYIGMANYHKEIAGYLKELKALKERKAE